MPLQIKDIIDLQTLVESEQVEFKLAGGKDGKGELPKDFWPTYSAMANGRGGWVVLGVNSILCPTIMVFGYTGTVSSAIAMVNPL